MSGRKNAIINYKLIDAQALSADFQSADIHVEYLDNIAIQLEAVTTDVIGEFWVQGSNNKGDSWVDLEVSPTLTLAGADKNFAISLNQVAFSQIRIRFDNTNAGVDGTVSAWVTVKMV